MTLTARPERRHAETTAGRIEHGSTFLAVSKPDIEDDAPVDQATAAGMPFAGRPD